MLRRRNQIPLKKKYQNKLNARLFQSTRITEGYSTKGYCYNTMFLEKCVPVNVLQIAPVVFL